MARKPVPTIKSDAANTKAAAVTEAAKTAENSISPSDVFGAIGANSARIEEVADNMALYEAALDMQSASDADIDALGLSVDSADALKAEGVAPQQLEDLAAQIDASSAGVTPTGYAREADRTITVTWSDASTTTIAEALKVDIAAKASAADIAAKTADKWLDAASVDDTDDLTTANALARSDLTKAYADVTAPFLAGLGWQRKGGGIAEDGNSKRFTSEAVTYSRITAAREYEENTFPAQSPVSFTVYNSQGLAGVEGNLAFEDAVAGLDGLIDGPQTDYEQDWGYDVNGAGVMGSIQDVRTDTNDGVRVMLYQNPLDGAFAIVLPQFVENSTGNVINYNHVRSYHLPADLTDWSFLGFGVVDEDATSFVYVISESPSSAPSPSPDIAASWHYVLNEADLASIGGDVLADGLTVGVGSGNAYEEWRVITAGADWASSTVVKTHASAMSGFVDRDAVIPVADASALLAFRVSDTGTLTVGDEITFDDVPDTLGTDLSVDANGCIVVPAGWRGTLEGFVGVVSSDDHIGFIWHDGTRAVGRGGESNSYQNTSHNDTPAVALVAPTVQTAYRLWVTTALGTPAAEHETTKAIARGVGKVVIQPDGDLTVVEKADLLDGTWTPVEGGLEVHQGTGSTDKPYLRFTDGKNRVVTVRRWYTTGVDRAFTSQKVTTHTILSDATVSLEASGYNLGANYEQYLIVEDTWSNEQWRIKYTMDTSDQHASMDYKYSSGS